MGPVAPGEPSVGRWLAELDIEVLEHGERDGVHSWDIRLHGRRRRDIRATVIVQAAVACVLWVHYAPPLGDSFRKTYRQLLHWNDELPFAKFALGVDERLVLATELAPAVLDRDALGHGAGAPDRHLRSAAGRVGVVDLARRRASDRGRGAAVGDPGALCRRAR